MASVETHYVNIGLFHVDSAGNVLSKDDPSTTLRQMATSSQEHRIIPRLTGPASTPNSAGFPDVPTYLAAEAATGAGFAVAYMDQYTIVTQRLIP